MKYIVNENKLEVFDRKDFKSEHILECGQIFSYKKENNSYTVFSKDKKAKLLETENGCIIETNDPVYFENFFDLKTDYSQIKKDLCQYEILKKPIEFGFGIRILKQDLFETLISFVVSANNNIKRIQTILNRMREKLGKNMGDFHAFPTKAEMMAADEKFFKEIGAGYRAKYLYKIVRQVDEESLHEWNSLSTKEIRNKLISLAGVGPKVADCVLLFGFSRMDVFPVDTWIHQMYNKYFDDLGNREKIRQNLTIEFGKLSGYAQQYLFFSEREKQ